MRTLTIATLATLCVAGLFHVEAHAIEAVRGKEYTLSDRHGPWMIMVASFRDVPEERREEGLSAKEAADELVFELRRKGIPAYTYSQGAVLGRIETIDRMGRDDERIYAAQRDMVCVIAGNYNSINDDVAQKTLKWIKTFTPDYMKEGKSGGIFRETPGRRGPLAGAFLTINPLLKPDQVVSRKVSPEVVVWNNSSTFPLIGSKAPYSLQIATFNGRQTTPLSGSKYQGNENKFDQDLQNETSYGLSRAGEDAEQLANALREKGVKAFTHHDRYQSVVTVGELSSPNDPAVAVMLREYGPKMKPHPEFKQDVMMPESFIIPNPADPKGMPNAVWVFDLSPQVIKNPALR